ncbi:MAG: tyrosine-type recombinase/integrase [Pirellula sp.]|jgi:integrase|nr:site-specific integrase [Pirellula sp.]
MAREPGYCLHKPTGQAYVNLGGKVIYLGEHGTDESRERYNRVKAEWLVNRHSEKFQPKQSCGPTMADVCWDYLDHAEKYYSSSEYKNLKLAVLPVSELFSTMPAKDFDVLKFELCQEWWLKESSRSRPYINKQCKRLLRVIKWAASKKKMKAEQYTECSLLAPLKAGRTKAPETKKITCVSRGIVDATKKQMTQVLRDMVTLQELTGCRPCEVCAITPSMVDRTSEVWTITLAKHKTAYLGKDRTIYLGPQAQAVLRPYLLRGTDEPCFSPQESEKQRQEARHAARVTPLSCGNVPGSNRTRRPSTTPGVAFTAGTYARSIRNACLRAKVEPWAPNRLRHNAATQIRKQFGLDGAQVILGHSDIGITQTYAEVDIAKAVNIARQVG